MSTAANMYRVGDYVFFEINTSSPFQIRRIEELNKLPNGNVEAKVMCFYRRRDIAPALLKVIDGRSTGPEKAAENSEGSGTNSQAQDSIAEAPVKSEKTDAPNDTDMDSQSKPLTISEDADTKPEVEPIVQKEEPVETEKQDPSKPASESESARDRSVSPSVGQAVSANERPASTPSAPPSTSASRMPGEENLNHDEKHQLLLRELFLSRQIETLPTTHIRGKCTVTLLNEMETPDSYLGKEDAFFYSLVYDPAQKTILADKGEIRVGEKYQADVPSSTLTEDEKQNDRMNIEGYETIICQPNHGLTDRQIDQFLILSRAVGTMARAFDMNSSTKYTGLHTTVASASRDVTLFQAMVLLHQADYDIAKATAYLVPPPQKQWYPVEADKVTGHSTASIGGPLLCRDQMEEWSAAESNLFEEALEKYGKDFNDIRQDFLPWKSLKDIVEYYYMWKTTDRYIQQKRVKAAEAELRLKQVYIPTYTKPSPNAITANNPAFASFKKCCEGCSAESSDQWFAWGPPGVQLRVCKDCWTSWKKYGGLKRKHKLENFDKIVTLQQENIQGIMMSRPGDRLGVDLSEFGQRIQRCTLPGCSMQFANLQTLNQHLRRDHGLPWTGGDAASVLRSAAFAPSPCSNGNAATSTPPPHFTGSGPMRNGPRTRAAVFLRTTLYTKAARRLAPKNLLNARHAARNPFDPINMLAIRAFCQSQPQQRLRKMALILIKMGLVSSSAQSAGQAVMQPAPPPSIHRPSGQHKPAPNVATVAPIQHHQVPQKRTHAGPGAQGGQPPSKRPREAEVTAERGGDPLFMKWMNTSDDYYFHMTKKTKNLRRQLDATLLHRMGRQPHRLHRAAVKILLKYCPSLSSD